MSSTPRALSPTQHERLRRYLPPELRDTGAVELPNDQIRAHLLAVRRAVATYLPRMVLRHTLAERAVPPWQLRVDGSLLFADLSGSTALAERLGALGREGTEVVTEFLNTIFGTMVDVVAGYGGDLLTFGGDALLVLFDGPDHAATAAAAALALQHALHGYVRTVPGVGSFPMHLHVGVESGRIALASGGSERELHYCALGRALNGVAAAETLAGPGEIVIGPRARALLGPAADGEATDGGALLLRRLLDAPAPRPPAETPEEDEGDIGQLLDDLDRISPYLPPTLLARIAAAPERPQVEADLRPVTALFAQVAGLERLAESLDPAESARAAQEYLRAMQEAVARFGGVVNKLDAADEGVKLLAIFGAPTAYEDHAERAARAALHMQERLEQLNRTLGDQGPETNDQRSQPGATSFPGQEGAAPDTNALSSLVLRPWSGEPLRQRIGVNLGVAFAGNVGGAGRKEYTVMGDAINVAARVMASAAWGEVWCSAEVARATQARLLAAPRGPIALKGKAAPLDLFQLTGERDLPNPVLAAYHAMGRLVGRAAELTALREHLRAALAGAGRAVRVFGEAGVGKSHLVAALVAEAQEAGARVLAAACYAHTASAPYAAWGEWLKALCEVEPGEPDDRRAERLRARLAALGPGQEEWLPLLGDMVRLDVPENRLTRGLDGQLRQERRFALLTDLLLRAAGEGPLLVLFEDFHWADPVSLDMWRHIAEALGGRPVLLLAAQRGAPAADPATRAVELRELTPAASAELIDELTGDAPLPEALRRALAERSAGNPLFLAELLRAVQEHMSAGQPGPGDVLIDALPDSLSGLLLSRIDRLDEASRTVLRSGSVIGQRIPLGVLHALSSADWPVLVRQLSRLDEESLTVLERVEPERVHAFRQALVQEVAYQSMLFARRRELHGRIGAYLERRYADDLDDYLGLLAHHYRLSDRRDKAVEYLLRAGHAARDAYANEEAAQHYRWALEALADDADPRAWEARDALGDVYATVGRYDEALAQHAAILAAPGIAPEAARRARRKRGNVLEKQGEYAAALDELGQAMAIARSGAPGITPLAVPTICADISLVHKRRGEFDLAEAACEEGLAALRGDQRTRQDELIEARLHSELGTIYGIRGDYTRARRHIEHSLGTREAIDDLPGVVASHNNLGYLWQLQGAYERAIEHYHVAEDLAHRIGLRYALIHAATNAAYALTSLGRYAEARARCDEALAIARDLNAQQTISQIQNTLGIIFTRTGAYERALASYDEALRINRALGSAHEEANALMHRAQALAALGRLGEAHAAAADALARAEELSAQALRLETLNALAEIALDSGRAAEAANLAREARALADTVESEDDAAVAERILGTAAAALGEPFEDHFEASIARFEQAGDRFELARTWAYYSRAQQKRGNQTASAAYLLRARDTFIELGAAGELRRLTSAQERSD